MADIDARPVAPAEESLYDGSFRDDIENRAETYEEFEEVWRDISASMNDLRYETDPEERLRPENLIKAYAASFAFSEKVEVTREPFERGVDLTDHVREHFVSLFKYRDDLRLSLGWDEEDLLRAAETIYIDDAVFRHVTVTSFTTKDEDSENFRFNIYPEEASDWIVRWLEKADVLWSPFREERSIDAEMDEVLDELYDSRSEFIERSDDLNLFLPISTERIVDPDEVKPNIKRRIRRENPSEKLIHDYCYSRVEAIR